VSRPPDWDFEIADADGLAPEEVANAFRQQIYLEPIDAPVLFGVPEILTVGLLDKNKGPTMWLRRQQIAVTQSGDIEHKTSDSIGFQYMVRSRIDPPPVHALRAADRSMRAHTLGPTLTRTYLQLPRDLDPKVKKLAEEVTKNAGNDYDRAEAIERHLAMSYEYTTDLPDTGSTPPLEAFLFETKRGHCEFFASAMVIMLRAVGIPARSVNGFRGGQWNDFDDFLAVRNADAHSWVEVYFGPRQWVTFDPTPMAADVSEVTAWHGPLSKIYDSLKFKWLKYVVEYDLETQIEFLRQASEALGADPGGVRAGEFGWTLSDLLHDLKHNALPSFLLVLVALVAGIVVRSRGRQNVAIDAALALGAAALGAAIVTALWKPEVTEMALGFGLGLPLTSTAWAFVAKRGLGGRRRTARAKGVTALYVLLRQAFVDRGLALSNTDGPEAFVRCVGASELPGSGAVAHVVARYVQIRFGGGDLEPNELRDLRRAVSRVRKDLAKKRPKQRAALPAKSASA
jgi:hypothetical protein